ncbi:hypothetical protein B0H13DRAFT_2676062 [Mycena leptocephala]|nr:hypothetical protein B0H13DRAFT_2676062 [Mycena leptocephala]
MSLKPISLTISSTSRATLCPDGVGIVWDVTGVQLAISETTQPGHPSHPKIVEEIKFEHEDILDVAVHDDDLFILTAIPTGTQWRRELRRRENWNDDPLTKDHTLQSYFLRLFSVQKRTQTGTTLRLPRQGCYASIWTPPRSANEEWHRFHEELTWDPDLIAKKLGFQNYQEEIAHVRATGDAHSPGNLGWQSGSAGSAEVHAVDGGYVYRGITGAFISTPTTFCEDDWISVTVLGLETASQVFFRVSKLIHRARSNSQGYVDHITRETRDPFIRYAFKGLGPSLSGRVVLLPAVDLDRNAELPLASLRFLHLGARELTKKLWIFHSSRSSH